MSKAVIIVEGHTDRVVFENLIIKMNLSKIIKKPLRIFENYKLELFDVLCPPEDAGKYPAIQYFCSYVKEKTTSNVFLAVDLDDENEAELLLNIEEKSGGKLNFDENGIYSSEDCFARIIPLGRPELQEEWDTERFMFEVFQYHGHGRGSEPMS